MNSKILITPLKIINNDKGNVYHGLKVRDKGYIDFGEAYFSKIIFNKVKAWKRHKKMTVNIILPIGKILLVTIDNRDNDKEIIQEIILSEKNYNRITIPPKIWFGFKGLSKSFSLVCNIADIKHNKNECDDRPINFFEYKW